VSLQPGSHVGPYEILSAIGTGGMGEVYRAKDTKLNRDIAIGVLPALFANDTERLARFTREAQYGHRRRQRAPGARTTSSNNACLAFRSCD